MLHRETYVPTETEYIKIKNAILNYPRRNKPETNRRDYLIFLLGSLSGMRINEILKIRLEHINWERRTITIPAENSKNCREGFIYLCDTLISELNRYIQEFKPKDYLFYSLSNNSINRNTKLDTCGFGFNWRSYIAHAGLQKMEYIDKQGQPRYKIRFHSATRTYFINNLFKINPNRNIADLSRLTRHRSIQCLYDYYLRFNDLQLWQDCTKDLK